MATSEIFRSVSDIIQINGSQSEAVSIPANTSKDFAEYVVDVTIPAGYKPVLTWYESVGHGRCIPSNFGTTYIANLTSSAQLVKIVKHVLAVRYS